MLRALPLFLALAACGEKAPASNAGTAAPESRVQAIQAPGDANSQAFARTLVGLDLKDFSPSGATGATIRYNSLKFNADGTVAASGFVEIEDERMDCQESGTWSMDPAESATLATVSWKIDNTSCAGREAGIESRARIDLSNPADPRFSYR